MEKRELTIERLAAGGRGVARDGAVVWFVEGGVPGDRVVARVRRRRARFVEAVTETLLEPSPLRRVAPCAIQGQCGGCPWMVFAEDEQRRWKGELVRDALERLADLPERVPIEPVLPPAQPLAYRNRVEFTLGRDAEGRRVVGLHGPGPDGLPMLVDVPSCPIESLAADRALEAAREFLLDPAKTPEAAFRSRDPYRLVLRTASTDGRVLAGVREAGTPFPVAAQLGRALVDRGPVAGLVRLVGRSGRRGRTTVVPVTGVDRLTERLGRFTYEIPAGSFVQVDSRSAATLIELVASAAAVDRETKVVDLYAGVGAYALELAARGARVTAVEADGEAVDCGGDAARRAGLDVRFERGDVGRRLAEGVARDAEVVVANPPRSGFGPGVAEAIVASPASRLVVVSCDPATLARDLTRLAPGFRAERVQPIDLFPQTAHVECVVPLHRR